jgi:beta-galactosidase
MIIRPCKSKVMNIHNFQLRSLSKLSLILLFIAGFTHASLTERLEAKYLKSRVKMRIDEGWKVQSGNVTGAQATTFNDATWNTTNVPHDFSITLVGPTNNDPGAMGWYRKHFTVPTGWAGKKVIVQFDGVYHDSKVYLNGTLVGSQRYGYVSFLCDLTPYLNATGDNVLAVFVDNLTSRRSRWYSGTGIFRHVWLIATDMVYVRDWGTAVTTPSIAPAQIRVQTDVVNDLTTSQTRNVETTIYDEAGSAQQTISTSITLSAKTMDTCVQTLSLSSGKLWSPSTPVRYYAYTRLLNGTTAADDYVTPFGIRELKYSASGFTLNGVTTKLKGACIHHNFVPAGSAVPDGMWERVVKEMKASGCTSIRTAHDPYGPEFYDLCDQYGMMVLDEFCDKWSQTAAGSFYADFDQVWPKDLASFIERDRNHPCIVMWSVGNEVASAGTVPAYIPNTLKLLVPYVKNIDKTRPVTHACVAGWSDAAGLAALASVEDIIGINYQDGMYGSIHSNNSSAVICGTEQDPYTNGTSPTWFAVRNTAYVVGHHIWTGLDYLGEKPPLGSAYGYLYNCGFRKSYFYYQLSQWSDSPMVHVTIGSGAGSGHNMPPQAENWNQTGPVSVVTYTNCESVDLYVNTTKVGTKLLTSFPNDMIMQWDNVPWQSGVIKALAMKGGKQVAVDSIKTVGAATKLILKPSKTTLYADGEDVSCIEVDVADADNNYVYSAANQISFTMSGAGRSLGIASGDWGSSESFKATSRKAFNGKVLIVIQSTTTPGTIDVAVSGTGLAGANLTLTSGQTAVGKIDAPLLSCRADQIGMLTCARNPGNKTVKIGYRVDAPGMVDLAVISSSGRMVRRLTNTFQKTGMYSTEWNAGNKSGVYFFVLKTNDNTTVRKTFVVQ